MDTRIVDTTLRDGEQKAGIALRTSDKIKIAEILDKIGVYQIEAGIPAMGGDEKKSVRKIAELGLKSRISSWNRLNLSDITGSMECGVDIIHISVPSSNIQIISKLNKSKDWVVDNLRRCINYCREKGFEVTVGLEDASRADHDYLLYLISVAFTEGVQRIRYADTVGVLTRSRIYDEIRKIKAEVDVEIEMHAHNDLGMAVANTISAVKAGGDYVDCTVGGIGERAGNCDLLEFIKAAKLCMGICSHYNLQKVKEAQREVMAIIY